MCFRYGGGPEVLRHVTLSIPAGTTAAFVGPSGGGKTTLAQLIARFFDPQGGVIRIGGVDARDIAKETLMDTVSFVFQDSRLIKASILDNVRLGAAGGHPGGGAGRPPQRPVRRQSWKSCPRGRTR